MKLSSSKRITGALVTFVHDDTKFNDDLGDARDKLAKKCLG